MGITIPFTDYDLNENSLELYQLHVEAMAKVILGIAETTNRSLPFRPEALFELLRRGDPYVDENIFGRAFLLLYTRGKIVAVTGTSHDQPHLYKFVSDTEDSVL